MPLHQTLLEIDELYQFSDQSTFTQNIPVEWIESALTLTQSATIRRRRLPSDQVLWLVSGLQVFAVDGVLFRTPDTPELREHFGSGNTSTNRQTPYPILRLVSLMNTRSHIMLDAQISPYRKGEIRMAESFVSRIPDHSVTLLDKGFWGADLLLSISRDNDNRHWLIPARKGLVYEEVEQYNSRDKLLRMKASDQARKRNSSLPKHWDIRAVTYEINGVGRRFILLYLIRNLIRKW